MEQFELLIIPEKILIPAPQPLKIRRQVLIDRRTEPLRGLVVDHTP
jgi:hypothetical protein